MMDVPSSKPPPKFAGARSGRPGGVENLNLPPHGLGLSHWPHNDSS